MPQTKAQILADQQAKLDAAFINPDITDKRHLLVQLAEVQSVMSANNPTSSGGTPTDITAGIDGSADIESIKSTLDNILLELRDDRQITETVWYDRITPTLFYIRRSTVDQDTGTISISFQNIDASPATPIVANLVQTASTTDIETIPFNYRASVDGAGYLIGDRIQELQIINASGTVLATAWFNRTDGNNLLSPPNIADLTPSETKSDELLANLNAIATATLAELGINADTTIPANNTDPATLKGLIRRSNDLIIESSTVTAQVIGDELDLSIATTPTQPATLKAIERGLWQTLLDTILNTGDVNDTTIPSSAGDPATLKGLNRLIVGSIGSLINSVTDRSQITRLTDGVRDAVIKAGSTAPVAADPALVVALSPNSAVVNLPTAFLTDITAIKTNTAKISQFSYQTAEDAAGTVFLIKTDTSTQASTYINTTTGAVTAPGQVELSDPTSNGGQVELNEYTALTTSAGNWTPNQILTRIRIGNTATGGFTSTIWQKPDGTVLTTIPVIDVDCEDTSKTLQTTATNTLGSIGLAADVTVPATVASASTLKGLIRLVAQTLTDRSQFAKLTDGITNAVIKAASTAPVAVDPALVVAISPNSPTQVGSPIWIRDVAVAAINTTTIGPSITPTWGDSFQIEIITTAITGAGAAVQVTVQETIDENFWIDVYKFEPITTTSSVRSLIMPRHGAKYRTIETVTGTTPVITRLINRLQRNGPAPTYDAVVKRKGTFNLLNTGFDIPLYGRTRRIVSTNRTATLYFWQIHDSPVAIVAGAVPVAAEVYQLPATSTLPFTVADFGEHGTILGANPRLVLSTTFATYTPLSAVLANNISWMVESL
jgi:hypothetical protein